MAGSRICGQIKMNLFPTIELNPTRVSRRPKDLVTILEMHPSRERPLASGELLPLFEPYAWSRSATLPKLRSEHCDKHSQCLTTPALSSNYYFGNHILSR
jgi:hypothetical protein